MNKAELYRVYKEICLILNEVLDKNDCTEEENKVLVDMQNLKESMEKLLFMGDMENKKQLEEKILSSLEELSSRDLKFVSNVIHYFVERAEERTKNKDLE